MSFYSVGEKPRMESFWDEFLKNSQRVLLLQGPIGPFFTHLQNYLIDRHQKTVFKINFNGGDEFYAPLSSQVFNYTGDVGGFPRYLAQFVAIHKIDTIVCFGDGRIYHKLAKSFCLKNDGMTFWAFEEGYLRPHYITFEKWGVNYNSSLCREKERYEAELYCDLVRKAQSAKHEEILPLAANFFSRAKMAMRYYWQMARKKCTFPDYTHHREPRLRIYAGAWIKAAILKKYYQYKDRHIANKIRSNTFGKFFIFPLQVHNDNQIIRHGRGLSMSAYIRKVVHSFALYAPQDCKLVIKHHPMDRGFSNYQKLITRLATRKGVQDRVFYMHEISMPDLLRSAEGMVVVNSTSGISALIHHLPVKVIGNAHYDIPGLTSSLSLREFWQKAEAPSITNVNCYLSLLRYKTQLNGSFYYLDRLHVKEFK